MPQLRKPAGLEPVLRVRRGNEKAAYGKRRAAPSPQLERSPQSITNPAHTEVDKIILKKKPFTVTPV